MDAISSSAKEPKVVKLKDPAPIKSAPQVNKAKKIQKKGFWARSLFKGVYGTKMGIYSKKLRRTKRDF